MAKYTVNRAAITVGGVRYAKGDVVVMDAKDADRALYKARVTLIPEPEPEPEKPKQSSKK
jgi:hypothetical protein